MEDKTQYEALMEELQKIKNNITDVFTELGDTLAKILPDVEIPDEEEDTWEMECPYEFGDKYFALNHRGSIIETTWDNHFVDKERFEFGDVFPTEEAAELEAERRKLLTRFKAFRDECNNGWKPDWSEYDKKWEIDFDNEGIKPLWINKVSGFPLFGHFENEEDCKRAIDLFGDEIKELFVDCEED